jgi:hypothetical protein
MRAAFLDDARERSEAAASGAGRVMTERLCR